MNPLIEFFNNNFSITISLYLFLMIAVVGVTTFLSRLSETLKIKTNLSDGVIAGLLLGVITSLPEFVTCLTSVISTKSGNMGFGDIIGSNTFDLFILSVCLLICVWIFRKHRSNKINTITLACSGSGTLFVLFAMLADKYMPNLIWHGFNFFSIFILASYIVAIVFIIRNAKNNTLNVNADLPKPKKSKHCKLCELSVGWIIALIVLFAILLIASAMFLSYTSESLIYYHWSDVLGESFGGALLLGVVTSLPEIVCCANLCLQREYNMVIDTMVGSTSFNLAVLVVANIAFACLSNQQGSMYAWSIDNLIQVIVGILMSISMIVYLVCNGDKDKPKWSNTKIIAPNSLTLGLTILFYLAFIILGFVGFN